jgi:DNA polymerase-3 subunit beta
MKCNVNQSALSKAIGIVQKAVSVRTTTPILTGILIEVENNKLSLTATDLDLGIKTTIDCQSMVEGAIVVNARLISDFIRKLPSNSNIEITTDENNKMEIKCMKSDFVILCNSAEEYPANTFYNEGTTINMKSQALKKLIKYTTFAAAQDNMKPVLTGCLMELEKNVCTFAAIDGYRLSVKKEDVKFDGECNIIIPSKSLLEVSRIIEDEDQDVELLISDTHVSFVFDDTIIISNLLEGEFIKYKDIIKEGYQTKIDIKTIDLKNSIERVSLLAREDKNNLIIISIEDNNLKIESTSEYGNAEENIEVKMEGDEIKIGFNSKYILDLLRVIEDEELSAVFQGSLNPCIFKLPDNDEFIYLVLPVRIS